MDYYEPRREEGGRETAPPAPPSSERLLRVVNILLAVALVACLVGLGWQGRKLSRKRALQPAVQSTGSGQPAAKGKPTAKGKPAAEKAPAAPATSQAPGQAQPGFVSLADVDKQRRSRWPRLSKLLPPEPPPAPRPRRAG